ncbi:MAG: hypothetical protein J5878_05475 [Oscillospiraceae bacterium]|nr:hypothetical protein [Oscillospiraceae bacterium]
MLAVTIVLDEITADFYTKLAESAGRSLETVLADALFKLAGELSLEALARANRELSGRVGGADDLR